MISVTFWPKLKDIDRFEPFVGTVEEFITKLRGPIRTDDKESAPLFGPYVAEQPPEICMKHKDGRPRAAPHRCDSCVPFLSLAVFDVDVGTEADVDRCEDLLSTEGLQRLWYSSFSHSPDKPAYRLILFPDKPVPAHVWKNSLREQLLNRYKIPAKEEKCKSLSHSYYVPTCPPDGKPEFFYKDGRTFPVAVYGREAPVVPKLKNWSPPPLPAGSMNLAGLQKTLRNKANGLVRRNKEDDRQKGIWLQRMLAGEALADHGDRHTATLKTCGLLAYYLPGQPLEVFQHLLRSSVEAMIKAGSRRVDWRTVDSMLLSAMEKKAASDAFHDSFINSYKEKLKRCQQAIPKLGTKR